MAKSDQWDPTYSNMHANIQKKSKFSKNSPNFKIFKKFQNEYKIKKKRLKNFSFIKFQNFNIEIIILKNDKTIIVYHFGQYMDL
jgi:hypothetical protein